MKSKLKKMQICLLFDFFHVALKIVYPNHSQTVNFKKRWRIEPNTGNQRMKP